VEVLACVMLPCMPMVICEEEWFMVVMVVEVMTGWEMVGIAVHVGIVDVVAVELVEVVDTVGVDV